MSEDGNRVGAIVLVIIFAVICSQLMGSLLVRVLNKGIYIGRFKLPGICNNLLLPPLVTFT